jgi:hypothetical protein
MNHVCCDPLTLCLFGEIHAGSASFDVRQMISEITPPHTAKKTIIAGGIFL